MVGINGEFTLWQLTWLLVTMLTGGLAMLLATKPIKKY